MPDGAVAGFVKRPWSHALFGYDVFISYTRRDAREYANALAITLHRDHDLVVFLDDKEFDVGERLPVLLRAARRSRMVVVLASPQVSLSRFVPQEVAAAQAKGRRIVPIDVAGTLAANNAGPELAKALQDEKWETETNALPDGPSQAVVSAITRSRGGLKRRVQQRLFYTSIVVVLLALTGYAFRLAAQREAAFRAESLRAEHARRLAYARQLRLASELAPREPARARAALDDDSRSPADLRDVTWNLISAASRRELWAAADGWGPQALLAYLPDGRLFSLGKDGAARITPSGTASDSPPVARIDGTPLGFDPQKDMLVVRTSSGELAIWNASRGGEARRIDPGFSPVSGAGSSVSARESAAIRAAALSSSGRTLAAIAGNSLRFWDVATGEEIRGRVFPSSSEGDSLPDRPVAIQPITGSGEGFIAAVTQDLDDGYYRAAAIRLDEDGSSSTVAQVGSASAVGLSIAPGSGRVALHVKSSDADIAHYAGHSRVLVYEGANPKTRPMFTHQLTQQTVTALSLDARGERLAMATSRGTIRIVDAATGGVQAEVGVPGELSSIAVHPDGDRFAVLSKDGRASEQLAYPARPVLSVATEKDNVRLPRLRAFHPQGDAIVYTWTALVDDTMGGQYVLDRQTGQPLHPEPVFLTADFLPLKYSMARVYTDIVSGLGAVVGPRQWLVNIDLSSLDWHRLGPRTAIDKGAPRRRKDLEEEHTRRVEPSPDGRQLASVRHQGAGTSGEWPTRDGAGPWILEIIDAHNPGQVRNIWNAGEYPTDLRWSPDGRVLALALAGGGVRLWRTNDWSVAADLATGAATRLSFGRSGTRLAATWQFEPSRAMLAIIDVVPGRVVKRLPVSTTAIDVVRNLSGSRVALGLRDGAVAIVDTETATVRLSGGPAGTRVVAIDASDDGRTLLVTRLREGDAPLCTLADAEFGHDLLELQVNGEPARAAALLAGARGVVLASDEALYTWSAPIK